MAVISTFLHAGKHYNRAIALIAWTMRFILVYKYGILQTKTERIDVNFCETTQQLLEYL